MKKLIKISNKSCRKKLTGKRILSVLLVIIMCLGFFCPVEAAEQNYDYYTEEEKAIISANCLDLDELLSQRFYSSDSLAYWATIEKLTKSRLDAIGIDDFSKVLGVYADEEKCLEYLANIYMLQQMDLADAIGKQSQYDELVDLEHYLERVADICLSGLGVKGIDAIKTLTVALNTADTAEDFYDNYGETMKYLSLMASDYQGIEKMCSAIEQYSVYDELKNAAKKVKKVGKTLLDERMKALADMTKKDIIDFNPASFATDLTAELLKSRSMSFEEEIFTERLEILGQVLSGVDFGLNAGLLVGDIVVGTTNTFNRYQEMKIMSDIAECMVKAIAGLEIRDDDYSDKTMEAISDWCDYNRVLITTHARGEYLIYQLVSKDGKAQSEIRSFVECWKLLAGDLKMTLNQWYEEKNKQFLFYMELVNTIFDIEVYKDHADYSDMSTVPVIEFTGIFGQVIDEETKEPIAGVSVQYQFNGSGSGVLTDENGAFSALNLEAGTYTITATKRGYENSESIKLRLKEDKLIFLKEPIEMKKAEQSDDTWEAANGMSGPIEYVYDEEGKMTEMYLINQENGCVYRRLTYEYEDLSGGGSTCHVSTYGPNDILLYTMTEDRNAEGYLTYQGGRDVYKDETSSSRLYNGESSEQSTSGTLYEYRDGADDYWIYRYNKNGVERKDRYFKDAVLIESEIYEYGNDGRISKMEYQRGGLNKGYYTPKYDEEDRIIEYWRNAGSSGYPLWGFEYDEEGRQIKQIRYQSDGRIEEQRELEYDADGYLEKCVIQCNDTAAGTFYYKFYYEDGFLTCREGVTLSISSGDVGSMEYEYYNSGVVKTLICYDDSYNATYDDLAYIFFFNEDGSLKAEATYDYTYNSDDGSQNTGSGDPFRTTRDLNVIHADGSKTYYEWVEETEQAEGELSIHYYNAEGERTDSDSQDFHEAIPAENEVEKLREFLND